MIRPLTAALISLLAATYTQNVFSSQLERENLADNRGFINVWLLQKDVIEAETAAVSDNKKQCYLKRDPIFHPGSKESLRLINQEKKCVKQVAAAFARYQKLRQAFNAKWQPALQKAINLGDQVAEVIWRQCTTTSILDRSALASTCDNDPQRRKEATQRLEEIGFEAAIDRNPHLDIPQDKLREQNQVITIHQMESGVYGNWTIYDSTGSNGANSPEKLEEIRRFAVIDAALTLVRRSFTYVRGQAGNEYESHAKLQLNRRPLGTPELAWNANVFHHGSLYTGRYDPARNGFKVYLHYDNFREITVGGNRDTQYLRMLYDTLTRSEQRIDDWLQRDPRWAVFLLNRRGHHEWVPERMKSTFGQISKKWEGDWVLNKKFLNFKLATNKTTARLKIRKKKTQTIVQFEEATAPSYVCELRYSGASSYRPAADYDISAAARGFLGHLPDIAPISPFDKGPIEPFTPMNPREVYPQVLIQCPQGEWPDNRTSRFFFLSNAAIIEVKKIDGSGDLIMLHWTRSKVANKTVIHNSLPPPFEFKTTLAKLAHAVKAAENTDQQLNQLQAKNKLLNTDELIKSLTQLRLEKLYYSSYRDFPDNLVKLVDTPDVAMKICAAYQQNPPDALQRFNFMVILSMRAKNGVLTPTELTIVPDCLRAALNDPDAWVRIEALDTFKRFAEEQDRPKLLEMKNDPIEDVRNYSQNALLRLNSTKETH